MSKITLLQGDCLELLSTLPKHSVDMVLCDLPYGTTACTWDRVVPMGDYVVEEINGKPEQLEFDVWLKYAVESLKMTDLQQVVNYFELNKKQGLWSLYRRIVKPNGAICLFGQEPFSSYLRTTNLQNYRYDIYWEKERLTNVQQVRRRVGKTVEPISVFYAQQPTYNPQMQVYDGPKRKNSVKNGKLGVLTDLSNKKVKPYIDNGLRYPTQVWKYSREFLKEDHFATQKPLALCEDLIRTFTNPGDVVLDNTMGWGTTGRACVRTERNFIGIELNADHFQMAKEKILTEQQAKRQMQAA